MRKLFLNIIVKPFLLVFVIFLLYWILFFFSLVARVFDDQTSSFAVNVASSDMVGVWAIEDPHYYLNGNSSKKGWRRSRLFLYDDGTFLMTNITQEYKMEAFTELPDNCDEIEGKWMIYCGEFKLHDSDGIKSHKYSSLILTDMSGKSFPMSNILFTNNGDLKINSRFVMSYELHEDRGILWRPLKDRPISPTPKPQVSDAISGENSEVEQIDTTKSVDSLDEK